MEQAAPQAAGSIWNPNSWHWEPKNYNEIAKALIEEKVRSLVIKSGDVEISTINVKNVKGQAEINIRKGKTILIFELSCEVEWLAQDDKGEAEGSYQIHEFTQDMEFQVDHIGAKEKSDLGQKAQSILKKQLKTQLTTLFQTFPQDLAQQETDPQKIEDAQQKLEQDQVLAKQAKEETALEKERIFLEQKEKEKQMKEEFYLLQQAKKQKEEAEQNSK